MAPRHLRVTALGGLPIVRPGDDIGVLIVDALARDEIALQPRDVVVVAQKIVSKAEGRVVSLAHVKPSPAAREWAAKTDKDPRLVELILSESNRVVRHRPGVLIVEHRLGFVMANAGIDQSNADKRGETAILLPTDPDASAAHLREQIMSATGVDIAVVINDSFGRPWRRGTAGVAIGAAGLAVAARPARRAGSLRACTGGLDIGAGRRGGCCGVVVDGTGAEGQPVVVVSGLSWSAPASPAAEIVRPESEDLFR